MAFASRSQLFEYLSDSADINFIDSSDSDIDDDSDFCDPSHHDIADNSAKCLLDCDSESEKESNLTPPLSYDDELSDACLSDVDSIENEATRNECVHTILAYAGENALHAELIKFYLTVFSLP